MAGGASVDSRLALPPRWEWLSSPQPDSVPKCADRFIADMFTSEVRRPAQSAAGCSLLWRLLRSSKLEECLSAARI